MSEPCKHLNFDSKIVVARVEDVGRFVAEFRIRCVDCDMPFQFLGIEPGFNYEGPTVTLDGLEANLPICPQGQRPTPMQGLSGYTIKGHN
jgi:hypothetical protein